MGLHRLLTALGLLAALWAVPARAAENAAPRPPDTAPVLAEIERRGVVRCGVSFNPGFAANDDSGRPVGFMVDLCRALAAAVLGKADAVEIRRLSKPQEFAAVAAGEVDVSFAQTSWTLTRDATLPIDFGPPVFHDEQGIAAWRLPDGRSPLQSGEATICVPAATTSHWALESYLARGEKPWTLRPLPTWPDALQAFIGRECTALATDRALLTAALRTLDAPADAIVIAEPPVPSREPIAPLAANTDRMWLAVVRWTMFALILADDAGVTGENAGFLRITGGSEVQRLLDGLPDAARKVGLRPDWAYQAIAQVGNYGEIFERNLGARSPFQMERGPNKPWTQGGLLYAPVFQ
ncbi:transporter substrate-binding domain-containing protein [Azospirillum doebereinerae]|uniref:Transporter substrate-binding domain-containing protein n=1 Tax=Azospirillum doebereinerae TaxID=92933 RepID=A0A3S0V1B8_9PROT|nr:transporter substrate-binding domain-containing protein [Azospirillum doebereinerae]RUQ71322.1 transporter substrate-binding domain-containing protein [Azospirillum doebereinerae]